ncbi:MAG: sigma-70 family RNA polymerase sigma factor [Saprospiraceae bacterium]|nr:sigma-70 family RNA polymerase sigma factor [Saprospiraceae bacterium]
MNIKSEAFNNQSTESLLEQLRQGKYHCLTQVDDACRQKFIQWAGKRFVTTPNDLEDAWQEALTHFYESVVSGKLVSLNCAAATYLFAVAGKYLMNLNRKMRRVWWQDDAGLAMLGQKTLGFPVESDIWEAEKNQVQQAMEKLSEKCRKLLYFRHFDGYSIPEIKSMTDFASENAVSVHLSNCLENLKKIIRGLRN